MIRVILLFLAVALVWILFFSSFTKVQRIVGAIALFLVSVLAMWVTSEYDKPRGGIITTADVSVCDFGVRHSYRTNYDVNLCLKNQHESATLRRIQFEVVAQRCDAEQNCVDLQRKTKSRPITIAPGESLSIQDSLDFKQLPDVADDSITWSINLLANKAAND